MRQGRFPAISAADRSSGHSTISSRRSSRGGSMKIMTWRNGIGLAVAMAVIAPAHAQYPTRAVRLIVPFPAGSGNDTVARFVQPQLSAALGQQVVIDNRAGAAGNLGAEVAAKSPADGYTVMMGNIAH